VLLALCFFAVKEWVLDDLLGNKLAILSVEGVSAWKCRVPDLFSSSRTFMNSVQNLVVFLEIGSKIVV
jgi:hypothetical protein